MLLTFEERPSTSPLVERVWRSRSQAAGVFHSMAEPNLELVVARVGGRCQVILRGPVTRASLADCPADGEWLGIRLRLGAFLSDRPTWRLRDHHSLVLPAAGARGFWLGDRAWEAPSFDNAEQLVAGLAAAGVIAFDDIVERTLEGSPPRAGVRSAQRRFLHATGLSKEGLRQIERARFAAHRLREGAAILDVVDEAGFFDQPHLTRVLRRLIGLTPAVVVEPSRQLSFLYKTRPLAWT